MYCIPDHIMGKEVDSEYVILNAETGYYYELNRVGSEIWQMIVKGYSAQGIVDALATRYETPHDVLEQDFEELVDELKANSVLAEVDESDPEVADPSSSRKNSGD